MGNRSFARRFWDAAYRAGDHRDHWEAPGEPRELAALMAGESIPEGARILDLGCGAGREATFLARRAFSVTGLDFSLEALLRARERLREPPLTEVTEVMELTEAAAAAGRPSLLAADVFALPLAAASVAFALDRGCLHTLPRSRRQLYARELSRVLAPDAPFLLLGAARDDEEAGLLAVGGAEIRRLFPARLFGTESVEPTVLEARAGDLPARRILLRRRR